MAPGRFKFAECLQEKRGHGSGTPHLQGGGTSPSPPRHAAVYWQDPRKLVTLVAGLREWLTKLEAGGAMYSSSRLLLLRALHLHFSLRGEEESRGPTGRLTVLGLPCPQSPRAMGCPGPTQQWAFSCPSLDKSLGHPASLPDTSGDGNPFGGYL